jgi:hypothetical protein
MIYMYVTLYNVWKCKIHYVGYSLKFISLKPRDWNLLMLVCLFRYLSVCCLHLIQFNFSVIYKDGAIQYVTTAALTFQRQNLNCLISTPQSNRAVNTFIRGLKASLCYI